MTKKKPLNFIQTQLDYQAPMTGLSGQRVLDIIRSWLRLAIN